VKEEETVRNTTSIGWLAALILTLAFTAASVAETDEARFTNNQCKVAFQPPPGWQPAILVQYIGSPREDGARPALTLAAQETLIDLSDQAVDDLANESSTQIGGDAVEGAQVTARKKLSISGLDAVELEFSYKIDGTLIRLEQVYIPVSQQNRTYLFTLEDSADHFADSQAIADKAISSFSLLSAANASTATSGSPSPTPGKGPVTPVLPLVVVGAAALAIGIAATYLYLRARPGAHGRRG
jgi:hypothetical protein